ncbi:MAG TPA: glycosyltransferase family 9 protein [Candidatus Aphodousia gallistercoris]|nr:glycosyltransferase family 9 protein [Candidatus Aphodousia gallistercoris]
MKVLIVSTRYWGDCLLAASLAQPIKDRWPQATVDMLTFKSNESILEGITAIDHIIGVEKHPKKFEQFKDMMRLRNHYDWALITMGSTRAAIYGYFAGKKQCMPDPGKGSHGLWKRWLISEFVPFAAEDQMIDQMAGLLKPLLGEVPTVNPACPRNPLLPSNVTSWLGQEGYVVFHTQSRYLDKSWSVRGWKELVLSALDKGLKVCFTGGPAEEEKRRIEEIAKGFDPQYVRSVAGLLSFGQTACLIEKAKAYVGVDTGTSHVAAATGTPCLMLFGPTDVRAWGPSPKAGRTRWNTTEPVQTMGNVTLIRHPQYLDCHRCDRHRCPLHQPTELGHCLQTLPTDMVLEAFDKLFQDEAGESPKA